MRSQRRAGACLGRRARQAPLHDALWMARHADQRAHLVGDLFVGPVRQRRRRAAPLYAGRSRRWSPSMHAISFSRCVRHRLPASLSAGTGCSLRSSSAAVRKHGSRAERPPVVALDIALCRRGPWVGWRTDPATSTRVSSRVSSLVQRRILSHTATLTARVAAVTQIYRKELTPGVTLVSRKIICRYPASLPVCVSGERRWRRTPQYTCHTFSGTIVGEPVVDRTQLSVSTR